MMDHTHELCTEDHTGQGSIILRERFAKPHCSECGERLTDDEGRAITTFTAPLDTERKVGVE